MPCSRHDSTIRCWSRSETGGSLPNWLMNECPPRMSGISTAWRISIPLLSAIVSDVALYPIHRHPERNPHSANGLHLDRIIQLVGRDRKPPKPRLGKLRFKLELVGTCSNNSAHL